MARRQKIIGAPYPLRNFPADRPPVRNFPADYPLALVVGPHVAGFLRSRAILTTSTKMLSAGSTTKKPPAAMTRKSLYLLPILRLQCCPPQKSRT